MNVIILLVYAAVYLLGLPHGVSAQVSISDFQYTHPQGNDLVVIVSRVINLALLWLGWAAFIYALYGGYLYITSGGDPAAAAKARATVLGAIIGVLIVLASYALTRSVLQIPRCVNQQSPTQECLNQSANGSTQDTTGTGTNP